MNTNVILKELTLEEKASLCSGSDSWHTQPVERLDIPAVMVADESAHRFAEEILNISPKTRILPHR